MMQWAPVPSTTKIAALGFILLLLMAGSGHPQAVYGRSNAASPFETLAGRWAGNGTIDLSDGTHEPIRCRAAYDVLHKERNLQLNIRCASESYSFDLRGSANYAAGAITGTWSEATHNAVGTISGRARGDRFEVIAKAPSFSASLTLITHGDRQSIIIQSQEAQTSVQRASISLRRSG